MGSGLRPFPTCGCAEVLRFGLMVEHGQCETATSNRKRKRNVKHYAGSDVSVKRTAICIVDETGRICLEGKVASLPEDLSNALSSMGVRLERIGLEAGPLSQAVRGFGTGRPSSRRR